MPNGPVDPASLEGDDLIQWYRRPLWQVDQDRKAAAAQRYANFFSTVSASGDSGKAPSRNAYIQQGAIADDAIQFPLGATFPVPSLGNVDVPELLGDLRPLTTRPPPNAYVPAAGNQQPPASGYIGQQPPMSTDDQQSNAIFDTRLATADDATLLPVGGKMPKIRRQWSIQEGKDWPTVPETGRNYDGHHKVPKSEGGPDSVENIEPIDPMEHRNLHMGNGDFSKWANWRWKGRPAPPKVSGLGVLQLIPDVTGVLSGRIRTDSVDNFFSDMLGIPSQDDIRQYHEQLRKKLAPNFPSGTWVAET